MYQPIGFAQRIFNERYSIDGKETWSDACKRVANTIVAAELPEKTKFWTDQFYGVLVNNLFMPGGRVWYACGRPKGQFMNCFVVPTEDSREGWGQTVSDSIVISGTGGGVGMNFSPVRPRGSEIRGHSGTATGAVSLMEIVNAAGEVIRAGGGRRTALMMCLNHDHPDTLEFLNKKLDLSQLTNANVSTVFMNESLDDFLVKVEQDKLHAFVWRDKVVKYHPARDLWRMIISHAVQCGEPGILNGWLANEQNNIAYHAPLVSTNPCGEIWLNAYGSCDLGALVLPRFVVKGKLDRRLLARTITTAVRFLDNVLDVTHYPLRAIEDVCKNVRRLGLGVMGLHDMLILLGMKYSSDEALEFIDSLLSFIKKKAYDASIDLAIEKGSFPALVRQKFVESGFCRGSLSDGRKERILANGIRNCAILTIAPTGTTSIVSGVTSGIEPMYTYAYRRRFQSGDERVSEVVEHPLFRELKKTPKATLFEAALEISPTRHLEVQATCQRHIDNSLSKTINLPESATVESVDGPLRRFASQLKGVTMFREGSRGQSPFEPLSIEEALSLEGAVENSEGANATACASGKCDI